jgi:hypothetical protein
LLFERGIDIFQETVRFWWSRFGYSGFRASGIVFNSCRLKTTQVDAPE